MSKIPYIIIELANTHGGDIQYLHELIDSFSIYSDSYGIKFQPLSPDTLATPDFQWYPVYQKLYFSPNQWKDVFQKAAQTKDVWLDLFDSYGVQILKENIELIHGIKFQSSVLYNEEVISALKALDLSSCRLILNIAAQAIDDIKERVSFLKEYLNPRSIWLEIGFQAYPTELTDSGLSKIMAIKEQLNYPIVFADHVDGTSENSIYLPLLAWQQGIDVIEKHVMLESRKTEYDHFSALTPTRFQHFIKTLESYAETFQAAFINQREREYLEKTVMIPVAKKNLSVGDLVHPTLDIHFRRSGKSGLTLPQILEIQQGLNILKTAKSVNETFQTEDFKPAKIGAIIACRMKSSRLKEKALLPIGGLPSVEFCLRNALKLSLVNQVILATSTEEQDQILAQHTYSEQVSFYQGHPDDVMQRYVDVCDIHQLDVVVRITADMPFIDDEICHFLILEHFKSGADYTTGIDAAVGVNLEIFNVSILKQVKSHFPMAEYSEYMTWYFQNNPECVKINKVKLPDIFVRPYRLTLDYDEDLQLFNAIDQKIKSTGCLDYSLRDVMTFLDENPIVASLNSHLTLKYKTDQSLIDLLNKKTKIQK